MRINASSSIGVLMLLLLIHDTFSFVPSAITSAPSKQSRPSLFIRKIAPSMALKEMDAARCDVNHQSTRRTMLLPLAVWLSAIFVKPVQAVEFTTVQDGQGTYDVPRQWKESGTSDDGKVFSDPVSGQVLQGAKILTVSTDATVTSIKDLGRLEKIKFSKQFGVDAQLNKADMISAALRKGKDGTLFYDFDLALAPSKCSREQEIVTGSCSYDKIVLLSACAKAGSITVLQVTANAAQWRANGPTLRSLRNSFGAL